MNWKNWELRCKQYDNCCNDDDLVLFLSLIRNFHNSDIVTICADDIEMLEIKKNVSKRIGFQTA